MPVPRGRFYNRAVLGYKALTNVCRQAVLFKIVNSMDYMELKECYIITVIFSVSPSTIIVINHKLCHTAVNSNVFTRNKTGFVTKETEP